MYGLAMDLGNGHVFRICHFLLCFPDFRECIPDCLDHTDAKVVHLTNVDIIKAEKKISCFLSLCLPYFLLPTLDFPRTNEGGGSLILSFVYPISNVKPQPHLNSQNWMKTHAICVQHIKNIIYSLKRQ